MSSFISALQSTVNGLYVYLSNQFHSTGNNVTYTPSHNIHQELQQLRNLQNQSINSIRFAAQQQLQNEGAIDLIHNQQQLLNRIGDRIDKVFETIFTEYMQMNKLLWDTLNEQLSETSTTFNAFYSKYKLGYKDFTKHQILLAFGKFFANAEIDEFMRHEIEQLEMTDQEFEEKFEFVRTCLNVYVSHAATISKKPLAVAEYRRIFQKHFNLHFLQNKVQMEQLQICWEFNEEATIAIVIGGFMNLIESVNDDIYCTAYKQGSWWLQYSGQQIKDLPNNDDAGNGISTYDYASGAFSKLLSFIKYSLVNVNEELSRAHDAPIVHSQEMADMLDECYTGVDWVNTAWQNLDEEDEEGTELPGRVFKRLAVFNEVFSINRPNNNFGYWVDSNGQLRLSSYGFAHNQYGELVVVPEPIPNESQEIFAEEEDIENFQNAQQYIQPSQNFIINIYGNTNNNTNNNSGNEEGNLVNNNYESSNSRKSKKKTKRKKIMKFKSLPSKLVITLKFVKSEKMTLRKAIQMLKKKKVVNIFSGKKFIVYKNKKRRVPKKMKKLVSLKLLKRRTRNRRRKLTKKSTRKSMTPKSTKKKSSTSKSINNMTPKSTKKKSSTPRLINTLRSINNMTPKSTKKKSSTPRSINTLRLINNMTPKSTKKKSSTPRSINNMTPKSTKKKSSTPRSTRLTRPKSIKMPREVSRRLLF